MRFFLRSLAVAAGVCATPAALAINLPTTLAPCVSSQYGCGDTAENVFLTAMQGNLGIVQQLLYLAAGLAIIAIIFAGVQMVISLGDEGKITTYKWAMAYALIGLSVTILAQFVVSVVGTEEYGQTMNSDALILNFMGQIAWILRMALNSLFVLMMVVAGLKMVYAQGKAEDYNTGKKMMYWAIAGAVLVNLSAALVYAVASFFGAA